MSVAAWLNGLTIVAPVTVADTVDIYRAVKGSLDKTSVVDVHITTDVSRKRAGEQVHVTVKSSTLNGEWHYDVQRAS